MRGTFVERHRLVREQRTRRGSAARRSCSRRATRPLSGARPR
jgi:hypothetical protein